MATRGRPLDAHTVALVQALRMHGFGIRLLSRQFHIDRRTVRKYVRTTTPLPIRRAA
jgi:hypothetical protein